MEFAPNTVTAYRAYIRAVQLRAQMRNPEAVAALGAAIAADSGFVTAVMERRYMLGAPTAAAMVGYGPCTGQRVQEGTCARNGI